MTRTTRRRLWAQVLGVSCAVALAATSKKAIAQQSARSPCILNETGQAYDTLGNQVFNFPAADFRTSSFFVGHGGANLAHTADLEGYYNTSLGMRALTQITTGSYNTAVGFESMDALTTGTWNTGCGEATLCYIRSGWMNTAVGWKAQLNCDGSENTAVGGSAMISATVGVKNTACGAYSLQAQTDANYNTALGYAAGADVTSGSYNTFIGYEAGRGITTGSNNLIIGPMSDLPPDLTQTTIIADGAGNVALAAAAGVVLVGGVNLLARIEALEARVATLGG